MQVSEPYNFFLFKFKQIYLNEVRHVEIYVYTVQFCVTSLVNCNIHWCLVAVKAVTGMAHWFT